MPPPLQLLPGQDLDLNPLLAGAKSPVELCKGCTFAEVDIIALRSHGAVGKLVVRGSGSGRPPANIATNAERDGAMAAQNLLLSVERLREWLAKRPSRPWERKAVLFLRVGSNREREHNSSCRWPEAWPKPRHPHFIETGETVAVETAALPEDELADWLEKCDQRTVPIDDGAFLVRAIPLIPGQIELGEPFALGLRR
jgi:hypothetical protein